MKIPELVDAFRQLLMKDRGQWVIFAGDKIHVRTRRRAKPPIRYINPDDLNRIRWSYGRLSSIPESWGQQIVDFLTALICFVYVGLLVVTWVQLDSMGDRVFLLILLPLVVVLYYLMGFFARPWKVGDQRLSFTRRLAGMLPRYWGLDVDEWVCTREGHIYFKGEAYVGDVLANYLVCAWCQILALEPAHEIGLDNSIIWKDWKDEEEMKWRTR